MAFSFIHDCFARVGGQEAPTKSSVMMVLFASEGKGVRDEAPPFHSVCVFFHLFRRVSL